MMRTWVRLIATIVVLLGCAVSGYQKPAPPSTSPKPETVSLRFAWPVGVTARVQTEVSRVRTGPKPESHSARASYTMRVLAHPEGRHVITEDIVVEDGARAARTASAKEILALIEGSQPSFIVSAAGEFVRVVDVEKLKEMLASMLAKRTSGASPRMRELLDSMISEQTLTAATAQEWYAIAGSWIGAEFEIGEVYAGESEEPSPIFPGLTFPMTHEFRVLGRVSCSTEGSATGCVDLQTISVVDGPTMQKAMRNFIRQFDEAKAAKMPPIDTLEMHVEIRLVTEPDTLLPHRLTMTKSLKMSMKNDSGELETSSQTDTRVNTYSYTARDPE